MCRIICIVFSDRNMDMAGCSAALRISKFSIVVGDRHHNDVSTKIYIIHFVFHIYYTYFYLFLFILL